MSNRNVCAALAIAGASPFVACALLPDDRLLAEIDSIRRESQHLMQDLGLHG